MESSASTSIVEFLKPRLNRRSVAFLLCLLLSALFWLLTSLSKEYVDEVSIEVVYENTPQDLIIVNEPVSKVTAEVKGFGFGLLWHWLNFETVKISVDADPNSLSSVMKGGEEIHYLLSKEKTGRVSSMDDEQLEVIQISPDTLFLKFKPVYKKTVPVRLDAEMSFAKQFGMYGEPMVEPQTIEISGLRELVEPIEFVSTLKQDWKGLDESLTAQVSLIPAKDQRLVRYSQTEVQVAINVTEFTEGTVTIPINILADDPSSVKVYPSELEVKYQVPLADYEKVTSDMFRASVTLENNGNGHLLAVHLDEVPVQIRQPRLNPAQVEYIVQK